MMNNINISDETYNLIHQLSNDLGLTESEAIEIAVKEKTEATKIDVCNFWSLVDKSGGNDSCWIWQNMPRGDGYGEIRINGKRWGAHRLAYTIAKGKIPKGKLILHKCDQPLCCNPRHLFVGTQRDNVKDAIQKGRFKSKRRKLSMEQANQIRRKHRAGKSQKDLSVEYGVGTMSIFCIVHNKTYIY